MSQDDLGIETVLQTESLTTGYRGMPVVHDVSLSVHQGAMTCIVGPNGCGKSTLLKSLAGLLPLLSGSVALRDRDVTGLSTPELALAGVGYVPQLKDVFGPLTVEENLELGGYPLSRADLRTRKDAVLEMFPRLQQMLPRHAGRLSGGERKMLAMARVLMLDPQLLLLDEPTAGLSEEMAHRLLDVQLRDLLDRGVAVLLVEQRANIALHASDYAYVLSSGRVRRQGRPAQLLAESDFASVFLGGNENSQLVSPTSWSTRESREES